MRASLRIAALASLLLFCRSAFAGNEPLVGEWRAVDVSNSDTVSIIELYVAGGVLNGRVLNVFDREGNELNPVCERCSGPLKDKPIRGMTFIRGLKKSGPKWVDGKVVDLRPGPFQGVTASCEIELVGTKARLFGYLWLRRLSGESFWDKAIPATAPTK